MSDMSDIHDQAAAYVLEALQQDERAGFEDHLAACESCRSEVARLREGLDAAFWDGAVSVPPDLRARVAATVDGRSTRGGWSTPRWLAVAAAVVIVIGFIGFTSGPDPIDQVLAADDAVVYELAPTGEGPAGAALVVTYSPSQGRSVLTGTGLEDAPGASTYQMWFVDAGGPIPAGLFDPSDGDVAAIIEGGFVPDAAFGITIEPAGGSSVPTGEILFFSEL